MIDEIDRLPHNLMENKNRGKGELCITIKQVLGTQNN